MNIVIDTIRIAGFRGINNLEIKLPRITVLIGTNNSGKTSVLKAMQLALGDYSRYVSDEDFHIGSDEKPVSEILVDARIVAVNENGQRKPLFDDEWAGEFGGNIKSEANGYQFLALRTRCNSDSTKGGFETFRFSLDRWSNINTWQSEKLKESKLTSRFHSIPFIGIEAQRDIHQELKEKSSFSGKVLSEVSSSYNSDDVTALEELIKGVNDDAVNKSLVLKNLKSHLDNLNQSFQGSGHAEITPFPKKIRDLSKYFSVHFGDAENNTFSMEYHGMGTRSWASMLTVMAFTDLTAEKHKEEVEPFFPILAAEEPEAHLHPSAQKTLYHQLIKYQGQVIISTHSPYLAAMAQQSELRYLKKSSHSVEARQLDTHLDHEEQRKLHREIIHSRGEILFSKALVLCEGETEEQALPLLFQTYFGCEAFVLGISFIGVGGSGKRYLPFFRFAQNLAIPVFVFSDGEPKATKGLKKTYETVYGNTDITNCANITILDNTDFEGYLISSGFSSIIESAIEEVDGTDTINDWIVKRNGMSSGRERSNNPPCTTCKQPIYQDILRDYQSLGGYDKALIEILDSQKTKYAPIIAEKLCELTKDKFPPKILELFEKIRAGAGI